MSLGCHRHPSLGERVSDGNQTVVHAGRDRLVDELKSILQAMDRAGQIAACQGHERFQTQATGVLWVDLAQPPNGLAGRPIFGKRQLQLGSDEQQGRAVRVLSQ